MQDGWFPCGKVVLKVSWLCWIVSHHILYKAGLQNMNHLLQCTLNLSRTLTEDEMAGWHHWLDGPECEWTPRVGDRQGGLACCLLWGRKESDTTGRLNWTELNWRWLWLRSWAHIEKFKLELNKVGETSRFFRHHLIKSLMIIQWRWQIDSRD